VADDRTATLPSIAGVRNCPTGQIRNGRAVNHFLASRAQAFCCSIIPGAGNKRACAAPERRMMQQMFFALSLGFAGLILATHAGLAQGARHVTQ
jgi:hypothetical protein